MTTSPAPSQAAPLTPSRLMERVAVVLGRAEAAQTSNAALAVEQERIETQIRALKDILDQRSDVERGLQDLRARLEAGSVGLLTNLILAAINQVLPPDREGSDFDGHVDAASGLVWGERRLRFNTRTLRGKPVLEIAVERLHHDGGDDPPRAVTESLGGGQGGSIRDLVSIVLRLFSIISLPRSRRFLVLDEQDAGLEQRRMPAVEVVLDAFAEVFGCQILMVTHHPLSLFRRARVITLSGSAEDGLYAQARDPLIGMASRTWEAGQEGVREVSITFQSHRGTVLRLAPGLNILSAANNIGKSAAVLAIRAIQTGDVLTTDVPHGQSVARVSLALESGIQVRLEHDGGSKVAWSLTRGSADEAGSDEVFQTVDVPRPVMEALRMPVIEVHGHDDVNPFIARQVDGHFLLKDQDAHARAVLLSQNDRALRVQAALALLKTETLRQQADMRSLSARLAEIATRRAALAPVVTAIGRLREIISALREMDTPRIDMAAWDAAIGRLRAIAPLAAIPVVPTLQPVLPPSLLTTWAEATSRLRRMEGLESLAAPVPPALDPVLPAAVMASWPAAIARQEALRVLPALPSIPEILSVSHGAALMRDWSAALESLARAQADLANLHARRRDASAQIDALSSRMGGLCPLCGGRIDHSDLSSTRSEPSETPAAQDGTP